MSCTCIKDLENEIPVKFPKYKGKKVLSAKFIDQTFQFTDNKVLIRTTSRIDIALEGRKTPAILPMTHAFCPFCGIKKTPKSNKEK